MYYFDPFTPSYQPIKYAGAFSGCCGSRAYPIETVGTGTADRFATNNHGILITNEKMELKESDPNVTQTVVETKNGPITVSIRHAW